MTLAKLLNSPGFQFPSLWEGGTQWFPWSSDPSYLNVGQKAGASHYVELVRHVESLYVSQAYWIRICILTSSVDSHAHGNLRSTDLRLIGSGGHRGRPRNPSLWNLKFPPSLVSFPQRPGWRKNVCPCFVATVNTHRKGSILAGNPHPIQRRKQRFKCLCPPTLPPQFANPWLKDLGNAQNPTGLMG